MLQDPLTLYKLIILYMLERVSFPLTVAQISEFILDKEYTNFLTLQQVINELIDSGLITSKSTQNRTMLTLSKEGQDTLNFFKNRINEGIIKDIDDFIKTNELAMKNEVSVQGSYYKSTSGEYEAHLIAKDEKVKLIDLTLSVPTEDIAANICDNWQTKNVEIYKYLIEKLF